MIPTVYNTIGQVVAILGRNPVLALDMIPTSDENESKKAFETRRNPVLALDMIPTAQDTLKYEIVGVDVAIQY